MVAIPTGGDVGAFEVLEDGCSLLVLAPGIGCKLSIRFEPFEADNLAATIAIIGDGDPTIVAVRGAGVESMPEPAAGEAAAASPGGASPKGVRRAGIAFDWRRGAPAPYRRGRVDLGTASCANSASCRVRVRARFVALASDGRRLRVTGARVRVWRVAGSRRVFLRLPHRLAGTPIVAVLRLLTEADDRRAGVQTFQTRLLPGVRRGRIVLSRKQGSRRLQRHRVAHRAIAR
jgi:hypothetical protein